MQTGTKHPFKEQCATEYLVKKETVATVKCNTCGGSGVGQRGNKCIDCTNGVAKITHVTEVDLLTALVELGLLKPEQIKKREQ